MTCIIWHGKPGRKENSMAATCPKMSGKVKSPMMTPGAWTTKGSSKATSKRKIGGK